MTTRMLLLADTHLPKRAKVLPDAVLKAADDADLIVHAGDWVEADVLDLLLEHGDVLGVWGNNDGSDLRARLPEIARRHIEGLDLAVIHETGDAKTRERRMDVEFTDVDVLVFGHSHIPWDTTTPRGLRLLNPGSPTDRRRQPHCTFMTAVVDGDEIRDVNLVAI
ncbi:metallophosphoesterase [Microbacterium sp. SLBN-146]|uniref:metallophosphoesterase family protein n=1 Tax=Microbacterium sp. SLBN-146 TaxID=2768457 RepID=UPI00115295B9|nr:YfcE family phosphodiesterase [Microbacterium sp. SLBN-146]TQJ31506.1 hypothetical protein FBY39_1983 [Microbacterium sp. SLBN-146]